MLPSNCRDSVGGRGLCSCGQLVPPPLLSCPVLSSSLLLLHTIPESTGFASTFQCQQVCVWLEGEGREAPSLLTPLSTDLAFSTPWFGHSDFATGCDTFPPITYVSKQVPDTLLCQPSSKHLHAIRKSMCWPQRAALLTAKWLITLTEGQKKWHWGAEQRPFLQIADAVVEWLNTNRRIFFSRIIFHIWFHRNFYRSNSLQKNHIYIEHNSTWQCDFKANPSSLAPCSSDSQTVLNK